MLDSRASAGPGRFGASEGLGRGRGGAGAGEVLSLRATVAALNASVHSYQADLQVRRRTGTRRTGARGTCGRAWRRGVP